MTSDFLISLGRSIETDFLGDEAFTDGFSLTGLFEGDLPGFYTALLGDLETTLVYAFLGVPLRSSFGVTGRFSGVLGAGFEAPLVCLGSIALSASRCGLRQTISFLGLTCYLLFAETIGSAVLTGDLVLAGITTACATAYTIWVNLVGLTFVGLTLAGLALTGV